MLDFIRGVNLQIVEGPARDACLPALMELWEASVRASHDFLPAGEVARLMPWVESALTEVPALIVARRAERPAAFMGLEGKKIEMLFVHPAYFRRGIGSLLLRHAAEKYAAEFVDCNEQNTRALAFYLNRGFRVIGRSETDAMGNPYPILHLRLGAARQGS